MTRVKERTVGAKVPWQTGWALALVACAALAGVQAAPPEGPAEPARRSGLLQWAQQTARRAQQASTIRLVSAVEDAPPADDADDPPTAIDAAAEAESAPLAAQPSATDGGNEPLGPAGTRLDGPQPILTEPSPDELPGIDLGSPPPVPATEPGESPLSPDEPLPGRDASAGSGAPETVAGPEGAEEEYAPEWIDDEPAWTATSGTWLNRGTWYAQSEFSYLHRTSDNLIDLAADFSPTAGNNLPLLGERLRVDKSIGYAAGTRQTLGFLAGRDARNRDHSVEFTFYGLHEWDDSSGIQAFDPSNVNSLVFTLLDPTRSVAAFANSLQQSFEYQTDFDSYELTLRNARRLGRDQMVLEPNGEWVRRCQPAWLPTLLFGFRALTVDERLGYFASGAAANRNGSYLVNTHNDLVGLQAGLEMSYQECGWRLGFRGKIGGYVNFAEQITRVRTLQQNVVGMRDEQAEEDVGAFVGEVNLSLAYYLRPNLAIRAGYDFLWINSVALAPEQVTFRPDLEPGVLTSGALFFFGSTFGVEMTW
jgi:hypothetical protein